MDKLWENYGPLGLAIIGLGIILKIVWNFSQQLLKDHKQERDEWRTMIEKQFDEVEERDRKQANLLQEIKRYFQRSEENKQDKDKS